jgi:predicted RNase H-like nuclease
MVRWFNLNRIIKYKKGPVTNRRREFGRYQRCLAKCLKDRFRRLDVGLNAATLLRARWSKPVEDRLDALFCALIGYHHWMHGGKRSEVIGDLETGFILLPM